MACASWLMNILHTLWLALTAVVATRLEAKKKAKKAHTQARKHLEQTQAEVSEGRKLRQHTPSEVSEVSEVQKSPTNDSGKISKRQKKNQKRSGKTNAPDAQDNDLQPGGPEVVEDGSPPPEEPQIDARHALKEQEKKKDVASLDDPMQEEKMEKEDAVSVASVEDVTTMEEEMEEDSGDNRMTVENGETVAIAAPVLSGNCTDAKKEEALSEEIMNFSNAGTPLNRALPSDRPGLLKESLKLSKKLREIAGLEQHLMSAGAKLDKLQAAKIQKRHVIEAELAAVNNALAALPEPPVDSSDCVASGIATQVDERNDVSEMLAPQKHTIISRIASMGKAVPKGKDTVQVWAPDEKGNLVLQFTSSSPTDSPGPIFDKVEMVEPPQGPQVVPPRKMPKKIPVPYDYIPPAERAAPSMSQMRSPAELLIPATPAYVEVENLGPPPGLLPPGLAPSVMPCAAGNVTNIVEESNDYLPPPPGLWSKESPELVPPPGLDQTSPACTSPGGPPAFQFAPDKVESGKVEVHAMLQSISQELNRISFKFTNDSSSPHLSRQSSESDFSTQASSGDGNKSPLSCQPASAPLPAAPEVDLAKENAISRIWDSVNMPTWGADCSQYSATLGNPSPKGHLSRQSSSSDFSTQASSGDDSKSPLSCQGASALLPVAQGTDLFVESVWANSNCSFAQDSVDMPLWSAESLRYSEYSQYPGTSSDHFRYPSPTRHHYSL